MGCSPWGHVESDTTERLHFHFSLSCIGEGNGNPLQCSCLENPRDGGAWWAAIYGVAQSPTRLKRLGSSSSSVGFGFPGGTGGKELAGQCSRPKRRGFDPCVGQIPASRSSPGGGHGNPLWYSCPGKSTGRGAWRATVYGVTKSQTRLSD